MKLRYFGTVESYPAEAARRLGLKDGDEIGTATRAALKFGVAPEARPPARRSQDWRGAIPWTIGVGVISFAAASHFAGWW